MSDVVIFHNPNCSTSRHAVEQADEVGADYEVVKYMLKAERPDRSALETLVGPFTKGPGLSWVAKLPALKGHIKHCTDYA